MRFLIGIDLGTTNSAVSFVDLDKRPRAGAVLLESFPVAQKLAGGEVGTKPLLPSFLYLPGPHDLPAGSLALPWDANASDAVGEFARAQGARVPGRLVSSAKSWLSHAGVDRAAPLLPWGAPPEVPRLSPLEVSARYLGHLRDAWNAAAGRTPADRMEAQAVTLTVPASFDDVARQLTAEAARRVGLTNVTLLEEPQAAFYSWLGMNAVEETARVKPGMRCLVADVGGGTSDFSLILAGEEKGELTFVREAVGDHLLLGGDNMDLALARHVEGKLGAKLDAAQFSGLVQQCRAAKERLLAELGLSEVPVSVQGRGRSVIGGSLSTVVTLDELRRVLLDGFFPLTDYGAEPARATRGGLQEMSLPYVADAAVTKHLAAFLRRHLPAGVAPDAILFNGGVFQPAALRERLVEAMRPWFGGESWSPLVLASPSLDLAVAWGAAYSGWLRHSGGRRIGGGIPRSYYLGLDDSRVLCVVPRRLEEGVTIDIPEPVLDLAIGQPVLFPLYTSTVRVDDKPGDVLAVAPDSLLELPPLHTVLRGGKRAGVKDVPVTLRTKCTEIGTLELSCVAKDGGNAWRLEFNVRDVVREAPARAAAADDEAESQRLIDVMPEEQVQAAASAIRSTFAGTPPSPEELPRALEAALELSRDEWPTGLCRRLAETVAEAGESRRRSNAHANRWYHLAGYCLRPGFGDSLDRYRVESLWKLIHAPGKSGGVPEAGADFWVMWRRVSGGLNTALQQQLANRLRPILLPAKTGKPAARPPANEWAEMWRCIASLERLDVRLKEMLGDELVRLSQSRPVPHFAFWSLARLGARRLLYGPLNAVLHPEVAERWLDALLSHDPAGDTERLNLVLCVGQLAALTGQRALDVSDSHRDSARVALKALGAAPDTLRGLDEVLEDDAATRDRLFGERLPLGLRLRG